MERTITSATSDFKLSYKLFSDVIYFKAKDIASVLGYNNTTKAILDHIDCDYKFKLGDLVGSNEMGLLDHNDKITLYITEPGLYQLIFKSNLASAKDFTKWVFTEVLPSIRTTGTRSKTNF